MSTPAELFRICNGTSDSAAAFKCKKSPVTEAPALKNRSAKPLVLFGLGQVLGSCRKSTSTNGLLESRKQLTDCYVEALSRDEKIEGTISLNWALSADGSATDIKIRKSSIDDKAMTACVMEQVGQIQFVKPESGICLYGRWSFNFSQLP